MEWIMEKSQDQIISKMVLKEEPVYLASGKKSKRTKIPFMDIWKKYKDGLKQCGFGLYKSSISPFILLDKKESEDKEDEMWIIYFRTRNLINNSSCHFAKDEMENEENHINIRNKYYEFFCKAN